MKALALFGAAGALALSIAACGETVIDAAKTEDAIEHNLEKASGLKVTSVDCPSDVEVKTGATFTCTVTFANGGEAEETFRIRDEDANVTQVSFGPKKQGG